MFEFEFAKLVKNFETRKKIVVYLHKKKIFVPLHSYLRIEIVASVAELVDALDSKSSEVTLVPVRFRPDVHKKDFNFKVLLFFRFFLSNFNKKILF